MQETWKDILAKHGPWAALAAVLLWVILAEVRPSIAAIQLEHTQMRSETSENAKDIKNVMGQVLMAIERSNYLERRNCINTAQNSDDREACARDRD